MKYHEAPIHDAKPALLTEELNDLTLSPRLGVELGIQAETIHALQVRLESSEMRIGGSLQYVSPLECELHELYIGYIGYI
jgi:hypothetical protein